MFISLFERMYYLCTTNIITNILTVANTSMNMKKISAMPNIPAVVAVTMKRAKTMKNTKKYN